jgi:hypothetical protein
MEKVFNDFAPVSYLIVLFSILSYFVGYIFTLFSVDEKARLSKSALSQFTETMTLGFIVSVFIAALFYTKGNTSFLAPVTVLLFWVFYSKNFGFKPKIKPFFYKNLLYFIFSFSLFSLGMSLLLNFDNRLLIHQDISFYARFSHNMAEFNLERTIIDPLLITEGSAKIYHYFNEWLTAIAFKLSNLSALKIFILFTLPCLTTMLFFNIIAVSEFLLKNKDIFTKALASLLVLATPGLLSLFSNLLFKGSFETSYSVLHGGILFLKLKIILLIMLVSLNLYFTQRHQLSIIVFSLIPVLWNSVIPAFIGGLILLIAFQFFVKRHVNKGLIYSYLIAFGVFGLYLVTNSIEVSNSIISYSLLDYLKDEYSNFDYVLKVVLMVGVSISPLLLLVFKKSRSFIDHEFKYYILFISVSAFTSFSLMHKLFNARQIILNFFYPLLLVLILFGVVWVFNKNYKLAKLYGSLLLIVLVSHAFYYANANQKIYEIPTAFQVNSNILVASDLRKNATPFSYYVRPYSYQMLDNKYWLPQRIDILDDLNFKNPVDRLEYVHSVSNQSFFKFASRNFERIKGTDIDKMKFDFLKEFGFQYLLVHEDDFFNKRHAYFEKLVVKSLTKFDGDVLLLEIEYAN